MKIRVLALSLTVGLLAGCLPLSAQAEAAAPPESAPIYAGDVNQDGVVDTTDARILLQAAVGKIYCSSDMRFFGDMDGNGKIETTDARLVLQTAVGRLETTAWKVERIRAQCLALDCPINAELGISGEFYRGALIHNAEELNDFWKDNGGVPVEILDTCTPAFFEKQAMLFVSLRHTSGYDIYASEYDVPPGEIELTIVSYPHQLLLEAPYRAVGAQKYSRLIAIPVDRNTVLHDMNIRFYASPRIAPDRVLASRISMSKELCRPTDRAVIQLDSVEQLEAFRKEQESRHKLDDFFLDYLAAHDDAFFEQSSLIVDIVDFSFIHFQFKGFQENADGSLTALLEEIPPQDRQPRSPTPSLCAWTVEVDRSLLNGKTVTDVQFVDPEA